MAVPRLEAVASGQPLGEAPVYIFGSALGSNHNIWNGALEFFEGRFSVIRFDLPGHGVTPSADASFTMDELADGVIEMATRFGVDRFRFAGVSISGGLALVLARRYPNRVELAGVVCSAATFGGIASGFLERAASVRAEGMGFVTPNIAARWFAPSFIERNPDAVQRIVDMVGSCDPEGYAKCCEALATYDETAHLGEIDVPVIVVSGELDPASPTEAGAVVAHGVLNGRQVVIMNASHLAVVENPLNVAAPLLSS